MSELTLSRTTRVLPGRRPPVVRDDATGVEVCLPAAQAVALLDALRGGAARSELDAVVERLEAADVPARSLLADLRDAGVVVSGDEQFASRLLTQWREYQWGEAARLYASSRGGCRDRVASRPAASADAVPLSLSEDVLGFVDEPSDASDVDASLVSATLDAAFAVGDGCVDVVGRDAEPAAFVAALDVTGLDAAFHEYVGDGFEVVVADDPTPGLEAGMYELVAEPAFEPAFVVVFSYALDGGDDAATYRDALHDLGRRMERLRVFARGEGLRCYFGHGFDEATLADEFEAVFGDGATFRFAAVG